MIPLIADNKDTIARLCREYGIRKLDVFGSAVTGAFDPASSDIDLIVDLGEYDQTVAERYLDFIAALQDLFGYPVELITEPSIKNPYFRENVDQQRVSIYDVTDSYATA